MRMIYLMIKKKVVFILSVLFCLMSVNAYALGDIGYYKYKNNIIISIDELSEESAVLIVGQYSSEGQRLVKADAIEIKNHNGSYESGIISLSEGFKYKFFVWDNMESIMPLYNALSVTTATSDGSGSSADGEYTEPY